MNLVDVYYNQKLIIIVESLNEDTHLIEVRSSNQLLFSGSVQLLIGLNQIECRIDRNGIKIVDFYIDEALLGSRVVSFSNQLDNDYAIGIFNDAIDDFLGNKLLQLKWGSEQ